MARFYGRFDSGSANSQNTWVTALDSDYFNRRRIGADSGSGARIRNGLISSRSLLSTDALGDIADVYRDGAQGTIVPYDLYNTNGSTFVSWSKSGGGVYTSPASTGWGVVTPANYRTRPTGSIASSNTLLTQRAYEVGVSYTTYTNATAAVKAALDAVQNGAGVVNSPYTRPGNDSSRTFHSVWHDENLQYFAWDDFTPGKAPTPSVSAAGGGATPAAIQVDLNFIAALFANDVNPNAKMDVVIALAGAPSSCTPVGDQSCTGNYGTPSGAGNVTLALTGGTYPQITIGTSISNTTGPANPNGGGNTTFSYNHGSGIVTWTVDTLSNLSYYQVSVYTKIYDTTITTSVGATSTVVLYGFQTGGL